MHYIQDSEAPLNQHRFMLHMSMKLILFKKKNLSDTALYTYSIQVKKVYTIMGQSNK